MAKRSQYKMHYRTEWENEAAFKDWILPVSDDHRKASCRFCDTQLPAHFVGLCNHASDKKHLKNKSAAEDELNTSQFDEMSETSAESTYDIKNRSVDKDEVIDGQQKLKSEAKSSNRASFLMPETVDANSEFLEMECETVDEKSVAVGPLLNVANEEQKVNIRSPAQQRHLKHGKHDTALKGNGNKESHPSACGVVEKDHGNSDSLKSLDYNSLRLDQGISSAAKSTRLKSEMHSFHATEPERSTKRRKLNKIPNSESRVEGTATLGVKCELPDDGATTAVSSPESANENLQQQFNKKRTSKTKIDWKRYKKIYRKEWELDPNLSDWVAPIDGDRYKAACRFCGCVLRAHFTDLHQHRNTAKHTRNAYWHSIKNLDSEVVESSETHEAATQRKDNDSSQTKESKVSACYMLSKSPWSRYRKRYRKQWESDPQFQGWIASVPGDDTKARCKYCGILLRAHLADLKNHSRTTKHANNIAYGRPFTDSSSVSRQGFMQTCSSVRATAIGRKKKNSTKTIPTLNKVDSFDLDRPDESLASIGSLTNLTTFGWCSSSLPETTLILPKHVHLDETLAASLPKTSPAAMFRVKKEPSVTQTGSFKKRKEKLLVQMTPEECNENTLQNLTKSVTLWEFLMMKVDKSHPNSTRPKLETILLEFKALQEQVKSLGQQQLIPIDSDDKTNDSGQNDVLIIENEELAHCIGVPVGAYKIRDPTNPRMNRNVNLLNGTPRRRAKHSATVGGDLTIGYPHDQVVLTNTVQKLMTSGDSEIQSLVIPSDQLQSVKLIGYDFDRQYADCNNLFAVNGHYEGEGDVQLYVLPISEGDVKYTYAGNTSD